MEACGEGCPFSNYCSENAQEDVNLGENVQVSLKAVNFFFPISNSLDVQ